MFVSILLRLVRIIGPVCVYPGARYAVVDIVLHVLPVSHTMTPTGHLSCIYVQALICLS